VAGMPSKSWEEVRNTTSQIKVSFSEAGPAEIDGNLAWQVDIERGEVTFKNGNVINIEAFATNIYQNVNGSWLMVSHQAGQRRLTRIKRADRRRGPLCRLQRYDVFPARVFHSL
jgi:hypothetical protein